MNKDAKIGLLALFALAILYYGLLFLQGQNIFTKCNVYKVSYPCNKNLSTSTPIKLNGHDIGRVTKIEIIPKQNYTTMVTIEVDKQFPLTDTSKVMLNSGGIVEENHLELELHPGKALTKDMIIIGQLHPSFTELNLKMVTTQISSVTNRLLEASEGITVILKNLEGTTMVLEDTLHTIQPKIKTIIQDIVNISTPLADPKNGVPKTLSALHHILSEIAALPLRDIYGNFTAILHKMESVVDDISNKRGTLGLLVHDKTLYQDLNHSVKNLNALLTDIKNRPFRYVSFSLIGPSKKQAP